MRNEWRNKGFQPPDSNTGHSGIGLTADGHCASSDGSAMPPPPELWRVPGNDCTQFAAMSATHSALALWLGINTTEALEPALRMLANARDNIADFWDFTDLYNGPHAVCNQAAGPKDMSGLPLFNSNYLRHQIGAAIVNAMNGQQWDASTGRLSFALAAGGGRLPFATAQAAGTVHSPEPGKLTVAVIAGVVDAAELVLNATTVGRGVRIAAREERTLPES